MAKNNLDEKLYTQAMLDKLNERGQITSSWLVWKLHCTFEHGARILAQIAKDEANIGISQSGHRIFLKRMIGNNCLG